MTCKCGSDRIMSVDGKVSDMCSMRQGEIQHEGSVIRGFGLGSGDYIEFQVCLDCGQIQNWKKAPDLKEALEDYD